MGRSTSLTSRIKERKLEAERKGIREQAELVAEYLGRRVSLNRDGTGRTEGYEYTFTSKTLAIVYEQGSQSGNDGDMPFSGTTIQAAGGKVFEASLFPGITSYVPGSWERELALLVIRAKKVRKDRETGKLKEERRTKKRETRKTLGRWGL